MKISIVRILRKPFQAKERRLERMDWALGETLRRIDKLMGDFTRLEAAVHRITDLVAAQVAVNRGIAEQIRNLPLNAAARENLATELEAAATSLAESAIANTPAEDLPSDPTVPSPDGEPAPVAPIE